MIAEATASHVVSSQLPAECRGAPHLAHVGTEETPQLLFNILNIDRMSNSSEEDVSNQNGPTSDAPDKTTSRRPREANILKQDKHGRRCGPGEDASIGSSNHA